MDDLTPDHAEEAMADQLDDAIPTRGYDVVPTVGLGGSAGSIPALQAFFRSLPPTTGMAYVVILHLSPDHDSRLAELIAQHTPMRVLQVQDTERLMADTVYVIPPGRALKAMDGYLRVVADPREHGRHVAVDLFFRTLADQAGPHATAIVLSGGDGDGAIGIKRIKERGGLTIAQDPQEAEHGSMPLTAIATGMVDWVLPVGEMGIRLLEYQRLEGRLMLPPEDGPPPLPSEDAASAKAEATLRDVLTFLRTRTARDFTCYKRATILRRLARRMQVNGIDDLGGYLTCLRTRPGEASALLQDLLISVTNFFRDGDCFAALERVVPELFKGKGINDTVRVWVAACATGEEAYSVAMLLHDHARTLDNPPVIQIFATDLSDEAIQAAREGIYPATIEADVSEERLRRYFTKEHRGYRVRREVRESVLFAVHDILRDSPFSRLDLVTCRNLMIYLVREAQARVIDTVHFALRPHGYLFLGSSESVDDGSPQFAVVDKKHRLFVHRPIARTGLPVPAPSPPLQPGRGVFGSDGEGPRVVGRPFQQASVVPPTGIRSHEPRAAGWSELHLRMLEQLAPPSILIDAEQNIVHLSATAGRFLLHTGGELSRNLLRLIHPDLRIELRAALYQASQVHHPIEAPGITVALPDGPARVNIRVAPVAEVAADMMVVLIDAQPAHPGDLPPETLRQASTDAVSQHLDRELERLKSQLRDTVEQYEASTEELKASNEELQAMNEELRSATEELETSREELQSINEELTTVNHELKAKVDELAHANSDLHNLMDATAIATVFLDRSLRITRYTPSAVELFHLIPSDVGRPLSNLSNRFDYPEMASDAAQVLDHLVPIEREVGLGGDHWYLARLRPYRTLDDRIAGVVLSFVDISERKQAQDALYASEERLRLVLDNAHEYAIFTTDLDNRITSWNPGAERLLGHPAAEVLGKPGDLIFVPEDRAAGVPAQEAATARRTGRAGDDRFHERKDGTRFWASGVLMAMHDGPGGPVGFVKILRDQTEARLAQQALERSQSDLMRALKDNQEARVALEAANSAKDRFLAVLSHELRTPLTPVVAAVELLKGRADVPEPVRPLLGMIERNVQVESRLIDDLLDLTRISRGSLDIERVPVDAHAAVRDALDICRPDLDRKRLSLSLSLDAPRSQVAGDPHRLQQVVWNLLKNAAKFTPAEGSLRLETRNEADRWILAVTDSGVGITDDELPRIFEAFSQGGAWVAPAHGGLGLGLSISRATVEAHGGSLHATSAGRGAGATFIIELPLMSA